jgi:hypothetical protein
LGSDDFVAIFQLSFSAKNSVISDFGLLSDGVEGVSVTSTQETTIKAINTNI